MRFAERPVEERLCLVEALERLRMDLGDVEKERLLDYLHLLQDANEKVNLTRITTIKEGVVLHLEDSLAVYPEFNHSSGRFCDLGTGGGVPGIPLAIVSGRPGILLDSVKKKANQVSIMVGELNLADRVDVLGMRSEELSRTAPASFDTVVVRAVSSFAAVEELATPLLRIGGHLVAMRGVESPEEVARAASAAGKLGLEIIQKREFSIGGGQYQRSVYVLERVGNAEIELPRRVGLAQKRPLD